MISWGGLLEAEADLTAKGYQFSVSDGQYVSPTDAAAVAAAAQAASQNSAPATDAPSVPTDVVGPTVAPQDATPDAPSSST